MRVVVTGGSGKLGRAVVAGLRDRGDEVVNLDAALPRTEDRLSIKINLRDYGQTVDALTAVDDRYHGVDALVHLAAIPAPGLVPNVETFHNNMNATYNVFSAARVAGIKNIVWASSETVLGLPFNTPPPYLPVDEVYAARPESTYSLCKTLEEEIARQFCRWDPALKMVGLRFSNVMEPADYAAFPDFNADPLSRKWNLWAYIDARDGAQAVRRALDYAAAGMDVFIIANADTVMTTPSEELAKIVFPDVPLTKTLGVNETLLSIEKARRLLGYEPRYSWRDEASRRP